MNDSFEDCVVLMDFHKKHNGDWENTLNNYKNLMLNEIKTYDPPKELLKNYFKEN